MSLSALSGLSGASGAIGPQLVPGNLVASYRFADGGGSSLADATGNGNTGTLAGTTPPVFVASPQQLLFSGDLSRVALPDMSTAAGATITLHATFRADVIDGTTRTVMRYLSHAGAPFASAMIFTQSGNIRYLLGFTDNTFANVAIQAATVGTWYDVCLTYNGTTCITYVNGVQATSTAHSKTMKTAAVASYIGSSTASTEFHIGSLVAVQIYSRVLTALEVANNSIANRARIPTGANPNGATASNAAAALTTPTYESSGEAVHPDVIDFGSGNTWNGARYWMGMTPYPSSDDTKENPSILISSDGTTWTVPAGLTNPIDAKPVGGHNADPDLVYDNGVMYCYYEATDTGMTVKQSTDGITWTNEQGSLSGSTFDLSPGVVKGPDGLYHAWGVNSGDLSLRYIRSSSPNSGFATVGTCVLAVSSNVAPIMWHVNINWSSDYNEWHGWFTTTTGGAYRLYFATSKDGINWVVGRAATLSPSASGWDNSRIYRATAVRLTSTTYDLWYSAMSSGGNWHIGRTTVTLT